MAVTPLPLVLPQQLTGAAAVLYTSFNTKTRVDKLTITNTDNVAHQVTLYLVPAAGAVGASTTITSAYSVAAGQCWNCPDMVGQILASGGTLQGFADTGAKVTISAAGTQLS